MNIFVIWLVMVTAWNFGYPQASPLEDVIVAVILSLFNIYLKLTFILLAASSAFFLAKLISEFDERTTPILLPFLETGLPNMSTLVFSNSNASLRPS